MFFYFCLRDNFFRLLDDKTFKSEIVLFRVDEESSEVKENDRNELLPVLMRYSSKFKFMRLKYLGY